jgi:hypothetical protein
LNVHRFSRQTFLVIFLAATGAVAQTQTAVTNNNDGATGTVPVYAGSATLNNSPIAVSGGNVGIGTTSPAQALEVNGSVQVDGMIIIPSGGNGILINNTGTQGDVLQVNLPYLEIGGSVSESLGYEFGGANNYDSGIFSYNYAGGPGSTSNYVGMSVYAARSGLVVNGLGNVGIGTTTPGAPLEVDGNVKLTAGSGASMTFQDGTVQSTAWNGTTLGGDYAESIDVQGTRAEYEPGDVIAIDDSVTGKFNKSAEAYSKLVAGVYSTKPGLVGRRVTTDRPDKAAEVPMAMMGIVPTKVSAENGPIERGDLLVSSSIPGYAMKGTDRDRLTGAVIGKALAPLKSGSGVIEVLLALQ